jgi:hypothetical protein
MARPTVPRYYQPAEINFKNHWAVGTVYAVTGSGDNEYQVEFTARGFTFNCVGMQMHGKCKHTRNIAEKWLTTESA